MTPVVHRAGGTYVERVTDPHTAREIVLRTRTSVLAAAFAAALLALSGCAAAPSGEGNGGTAETGAGSEGGSTAEADSGLLEDHGLTDLDPVEIIDRLDTQALAERPADLAASVLPEELVLTDDEGREARLPLPEDRFYVSFAPYERQTHDCVFHSLTGCRGELRNTPVAVTVTNAETGEELVADELTTFDNGFLGLWLPRGIEAEIAVEREGLSATDRISTAGEQDPTCLTTLRLA